MKKTYTAPQVEIMEVTLEAMLAASNGGVDSGLDYSDTEEITTEGDFLSGGSLW